MSINDSETEIEIKRRLEVYDNLKHEKDLLEKALILVIDDKQSLDYLRAQRLLSRIQEWF